MSLSDPRAVTKWAGRLRQRSCWLAALGGVMGRKSARAYARQQAARGAGALVRGFSRGESRRAGSDESLSAIPYEKFRPAVCAFRPADLLPQVAMVAADVGEVDPEDRTGVWRTLPPWAFAAIGRESLLYGNDHRRGKRVDSAEVRRLVAMFNRTYDPDEKPDAVALLHQVAYEQFPYQDYELGELARTFLLLTGIAEAGRRQFTMADMEEVLAVR